MTENVKNIESNDMESKIIEAAKALFIEKGFAETNMSDIAAKVGINRPALHYYFRTKDRMFQAVFGMIIQNIIPKVQDFIMAKDRPISERVAGVVDAYYKMFSNNPSLPLFVAREVHRDVDYVINALIDSPMRQTYIKMISSLRMEMAEGKLNTVPLSVLFYTFYGSMVFPFLTKKLAERLLTEDADNFDNLLEVWKPYVIKQMVNLLSPQ